MIQRPQSLYLLLAAVSLFALLLLDLPFNSPAAIAFGWFTPAVLIGAVLVAVATLAVIFAYGNREQQLRFVMILQVAAIVFLLVYFGGLYFAGDLHFQRGGLTDTGKIVAIFLPVAAYVFLFLARRGVMSDIALVKSMDRLR